MTSDYYNHPKVAEYFEISEQYTADLQFYRDLVAEGRSRVLELGAGTGRVAFDLASQGAHVTGLELSERMLERARAKEQDSELAGQLEFVLGDVRNFDLPFREYSLIYIAEYSFANLHTIEDQLSCLASARRHLAADGLLVVHLFLPNPAYFAGLRLGGIGGALMEGGSITTLPNGNSLMMSTATRYRRSDQTLLANVVYEELEPSGESRRYAVPLQTHAYVPSEVQLLLRTAGFVVERVLGDFNGGALTDDSWEMIFTARQAAP